MSEIGEIMNQPVQRRRYNRLPVIQPATATSRRSGTLAGEIRNFSANGLLFSVTRPVDLEALRDESISIAFVTSDSGPFRISGRVARVFDRSLGIAVDDFPTDAYRALILQANAEPVLAQQGSGSEFGITQREETLQRCEQSFHRFMVQTIERFYVRINSRINAIPADAIAMQEHWLLRNGYTQVSALRGKIEQCLVTDHLTEFETLDATEQQQPQTLALVEMDTFDDWLAVSQLVNRLQQDYAVEISRFELRYAALTGIPLQARRNPYSANAMMWLFHRVLDRAGLHTQLKLVLYELFHLALAEGIEQFYVGINEILGFVETVRAASPVALSPADSAARQVARAEALQSAVTQMNLSAAPSVATAPPLAAAPAAEAPASVVLPFLSLQSEAQPFEHWLSGQRAQPHVVSSALASDSAATGATAPAIPDLGLNPLLWQFNWMVRNSEMVSGQSVLDMLADWHGLQRTSEREQRDARIAVYEFPGEHAAAAIATMMPHAVQAGPLPPCLETALGEMRDLWLRRTSATPVQSLQSLLDEVPELVLDAACRERVRPLLMRFDAALGVAPTETLADSDMARLMAKMRSALMLRALRDASALSAMNDAFFRGYELLERFHAAADDNGQLFDNRLTRLLDMLVDRVDQAVAGSDAAHGQEVANVLENLLESIGNARKLRVSQVLTSNAGAVVPTSVQHYPLLCDEAILAMDTLAPGDWIDVAGAGRLVPWQVVRVGHDAQSWLLVNRSVTLVREIAADVFERLWRETALRGIPEYAQPVLQRTAMRAWLNGHARHWQLAMRDPGSGLLNAAGLESRLDWVLQRRRHEDKPLWLCWMRMSGWQQDGEQGRAALEELLRDSLILQSRQTGAVGLMGRPQTDVVVALCPAADPARVRRALSDWLDAHPGFVSMGIRVQHVGLCAADAWIENARQWLAAARLGAAAHLIDVVDLPSVRRRMALQSRLGQVMQLPESVGWSLEAAAWTPDADDGRNHPCHELHWLIDLERNGEWRVVGDRQARPAEADMRWLQGVIEWLQGRSEQLRHVDGLGIGLSIDSLNHIGLRNLLERISSEDWARKLIFRLPEDAVSAHFETVLRFVRATRGYGYRYCLDEAGCLLPSTAWLAHWRPDFVRLNRQLSHGVLRSDACREMARNLFDTAHALEIHSIAEADNDGHATQLRQLGADYVFGPGRPALRYNAEMR